MQEENKPVWYLAGPMFQYNEDVKALAREWGLRIIDATATVDRSNAAEVVPEVTLKPVQDPLRGIEQVPSTEDLLDTHANILRRVAELDSRHEHLEAQATRQREQADRLDAEHARQAEQADILAAERARLQELAKSIELASTAFAPPDGKEPEPGALSEPESPEAAAAVAKIDKSAKAKK